MSDKKVVSIVVDGMCFETYPCQHNCVLTYSDNTSEKCRLMGTDIVEYLEMLPEDVRPHFKGYLSHSNFVNRKN
jgi:hypothetical protein